MGQGRTQRGAAIITAIIVSFVTAMVVAAAVLLTGATRLNARAKGNSEAALQLAEAGINAELRKVSSQLQLYNGSTGWDTPSSKGTGSISGVPGTYSVWTSANSDGTGTWSGTGDFWITSTATVVGATKKVRISSRAFSLFDDFAIFVISTSTNGNSNDFHLTGNADFFVYGNSGTSVGGAVGTNGRVSSNNSILSFGVGFNYGPRANLNNGGNTVWPTAPLYSFANVKVFPTVPQIIRTTPSPSALTATVGMTDTNTWNWLSTNLPALEKNTIYTWLGTSTTLSTSSCQKAYVTVTPGSSLNAKSSGNDFWTRANFLVNNPNTGRKAIILQPGDYYFNTLDLSDSSKELIIDNAGLTMSGGNPLKKQIRIWVDNSSTGTLGATPITLTNPSDPTTFRIYTTGSLHLAGGSSGSPQNIAGCMYVYGGPGGDATLSWDGGYTILYGSMIADEIDSKNGTLIIHYMDPGNPSDGYLGVGFTGGYDDGG